MKRWSLNTVRFMPPPWCIWSETLATTHLRPQTVRPPTTRVSGRGALSLSLSLYIYISHAPKSKRVIRQGFTTVNSGRRTAWQGSAVATDIWLL